MSLFTSTRERRLWVWTLIIIAAIYSTLGLTRTVAGALRDRGALNTAFVFGMILVGTTIVTLALKARLGGAEIGVVLGIVAAYLLAFVRMSIPEERTHLIEYGVVAAFIHEAFTERVNQGRRVPAPALLALLMTAMVGTLDECIQAFLPSRVFDSRDILFNALAGVMAITASVTLAWVRRRRS